MRAREFIINLPNLSIDTDQEDGCQAQSRQAVMVPPLQQELELKKAALGKTSPVIQKLVQDEPEEDSEGVSISQFLNR